MRRGFTLVELMMVIAIVAILAAISMAALASAAEEGKRQRVRTQIAKIDQLIMDKWNGYRFRQLPVRIPSGVGPSFQNRMRLDTMRELQRMELPDRLTDIQDAPVSPSVAVQNPALPALLIAPQQTPALTRAYRRRFTGTSAALPNAYDQAECLYAIIAEMRDGERSALDFFLTSEIGDVDGDGANEILDPWGTPIMFLRWAPGFSKFSASDTPSPYVAPVAPAPLIEDAVETPQIQDGKAKADPLDPLKADPRHNNNMASGFVPFELRPLIFSAGPDKVYDILVDDVSTIHYSTSAGVLNDPYLVTVPMGGGPNRWIGQPADYDGDGLQHGDNITNHGLRVEMGGDQ